MSDRERSVNDVAEALRVRQPQASKHLRVLREVGLVAVREAGRERLSRHLCLRLAQWNAGPPAEQ